MGAVKDVATTLGRKSTGGDSVEGTDLGALTDWEREGTMKERYDEEELRQKAEAEKVKQEALIKEQEDAIEKRRLEEQAVTDERTARMKGFSLLSGSETGTRGLDLLS